MRARRDSRPRQVASQRGIALVLALWLTVLLTVIASGFAFSMRGEAQAARNAISLAQARVAADGAVERTLFELQRPRVPEAWAADGTPHAWKEEEIDYRAYAVDEAAKIDLNFANEALLKSVLAKVGGLDDAAAGRLLDAIIDWRDTDDLRRPNGAEEADYRAANLKYPPSNAPFETVGELARVLGMTPDLFARIAPILTVYSRQPGINPMTASREVLLALPNVTSEIVEDYIARRRDAIERRLSPPPFPQAQAFASGPVPVWRIHAEATMPDGVTFAREAVLRPTGDARRPIIALAWLQGTRMPVVLAPDAVAPASSSSSFSSFMRKPESDARRP
jgi:general secretion pathway protein K